MNKANLLWIDLEMTGLDPMLDNIIEVGVVATDFRLRRLADYQSAVQVPLPLMKRRMVGDFWQKHDAARRDLMSASTADQAKPTLTIETELIEFVLANFDTDQSIYLAGNSVHQDRRFIEREWTTLNKLFSYRLLDVSAWKIIFENRGTRFTKPDGHRAMDDINGSIDELKYYLKKVRFNDRNRD